MGYRIRQNHQSNVRYGDKTSEHGHYAPDPSQQYGGTNVDGSRWQSTYYKWVDTTPQAEQRAPQQNAAAEAEARARAAAEAKRKAEEEAKRKAEQKAKAQGVSSQYKDAKATEQAYKGYDASDDIYAKDTYINRNNDSSMKQFDFSKQDFANEANTQTNTNTDTPKPTQNNTKTFKPTDYKTTKPKTADDKTPESEQNAQSFLNAKKEKVKEKYGNDFHGIGDEFNSNDFTGV